MGTSNSYGGQGGRTPLIPSWLNSDAGTPLHPPVPPDTGPGPIDPGVPNTAPGTPERPVVPPIAAPDRFTGARGNFTRYVSSGGGDRRSLGRALSGYVSKSAGGARRAAQRMGASRVAGARLLGFLTSAASGGVREALRALNLEGLAGRPIEEIFLGLAGYVCPDGGTIDEGIAREAFIETIADLTEAGITDLDSLTIDQTQTIFELYATNAIEARLCNDIGANAIILPNDARQVSEIQSQLRDFISRGVADALISAQSALQSLTPQNVFGFVTRVYEQAFAILQSLGEQEASRR